MKCYPKTREEFELEFPRDDNENIYYKFTCEPSFKMTKERLFTLQQIHDVIEIYKTEIRDLHQSISNEEVALNELFTRLLIISKE